MFRFDDDAAMRRFWVSLYLSAVDEPEAEVVEAVLKSRPIEEILDALRSDDPTFRDRATGMFWQLSAMEAGELEFDEMLDGDEFLRVGEWASAIECFTQILSNYPEFAEAYHRRAIGHYSNGDHASAIADCLEALARQPCHFGVWHRLGVCYMAVDRYADACEAFRSAVRIQPYAEDVAQMLGYCRGRVASVNDASRTVGTA